MTITESFTSAGETVLLEYHDADTFDGLPKQFCRQVYGLCFYNGQLIIGYGGAEPGWGLIGGTIQPGETFRQTLDREIHEESNMRVVEAAPLGYQKVTHRDGGQIYQ